MKVPKKVLEGHRRIWGGKIPAGALAQLEKEYARMPGPKKKKNPSWRRTVKKAKKGRRALGMTDWDFPSRQKQVWKGQQMAKRRKKKNPTRGLNLAPLRKVMKEAGTKKVRVMRSKSGKPTGLKFL